jgi:quinol monooxygenase YgiN
MIVVVGRVRTDAGKRKDLIRVGQAVAAASRLESGCLAYRLYEDSEQENEFVFVEEWESDEALKRHFATAHIAQFMQAIPATLVAPPDVKLTSAAADADAEDRKGRRWSRSTWWSWEPAWRAARWRLRWRGRGAGWWCSTGWASRPTSSRRTC